VGTPKERSANAHNILRRSWMSNARRRARASADIECRRGGSGNSKTAQDQENFDNESGSNSDRVRMAAADRALRRGICIKDSLAKAHARFIIPMALKSVSGLSDCADIACSSGRLTYAQFAQDHEMLLMPEISNCELFAINSADIEGNRGSSSTASFAKAQAVFDSICVVNSPSCMRAEPEIAAKLSLSITPWNCNVPQSTLCAAWGTSGKARKSHRANAHAVFAKFSGSNWLIFLITAAASAAISGLSPNHSVAQAHAMPAKC